MKSPFPGMDPYLEQFWGDVHQAFITYLRDSLQPRLPGDLRARMQERVYIEIPEVGSRQYYPDVRIFEHPRRRPGAGGGGGVAVAEPEEVRAAEPLLVDLDVEPAVETYIEVVDVKSGYRVVTSIEVLSPANKRPGEGRRLYLQKREDMMRAGVNTVEIDLLRGDERPLPVAWERLPGPYRTAYQAWVWRSSRPGVLAIYGAPLRERLPVVPIPLRPSDADVTVDLQAILEQCYRNGGYDDIDYGVPPSPPLSPDDAAWAEALIREQKAR